MSIPPEKPRRKFPPPCWTHEETVALIEVYRERWYALRRGYLRTPDWDSVALQVSTRCPNASLAKTSAQCRHKMEKLRQKYRTEKQRSLSFPGRFFSSWVFFDFMDTMEIGPSPASQANNQVKPLAIDGNLVLKPKKFKNIDRDLKPNLGLDHEGVNNPSGRIALNVVNLGFRAKNGVLIDGSNSNSNPNFGFRALNGGHPYQLEDGSDQDADSDVGFGGDFKNPNANDGNLPPPPGFRPNSFPGKGHGSLKSTFDSDLGAHIGGVDFGVVFRPQTNIHQNSLHPGSNRPKKIMKFEEGDHYVYNNGKTANGGFSGKSPVDWNSAPNFDPRVLNNGFPNSSPRSGSGKKKKGADRGDKREGGGLMEEMVSSIKLLGEGFVKVEKMKMEMTREIEQMRMDMEMKRSKLILDSQQQIVEAFVKVLMEKKQQKTTTTSTTTTTNVASPET